MLVLSGLSSINIDLDSTERYVFADLVPRSRVNSENSLEASDDAIDGWGDA